MGLLCLRKVFCLFVLNMETTSKMGIATRALIVFSMALSGLVLTPKDAKAYHPTPQPNERQGQCQPLGPNSNCFVDPGPSDIASYQLSPTPTSEPTFTSVPTPIWEYPGTQTPRPTMLRPVGTPSPTSNSR